MAVLLGASLAGCGAKSGSASADSDVDYIKGKKTLIVGITDFAPMDYKDDDGNWIGFDASRILPRWIIRMMTATGSVLTRIWRRR